MPGSPDPLGITSSKLPIKTGIELGLAEQNLTSISVGRCKENNFSDSANPFHTMKSADLFNRIQERVIAVVGAIPATQLQ